jgi:hypothetical protein
VISQLIHVVSVLDNDVAAFAAKQNLECRGDYQFQDACFQAVS